MFLKLSLILVLTGDLNARVGNLIDYIENDDIKHIFQKDNIFDCPSDIFHLQRQSKDILVNTFGKTLIDICQVFDIHIFNVLCNGYMHGEFTCTANDGTSVVDYFIAFSDLVKYVKCTSKNVMTTVKILFNCLL